MPVIYLIGARGSGKTTIGKQAANSLRWQFIDLDAWLCEKENCQISDIVAKHGWPKFRELESAYLREAGAAIGNNGIIATGGGIVVTSANRDFMRASGIVIWLRAEADILGCRLLADPAWRQRPALTELGFMEEIEQVLKERTPLYESVANHIFNAARPVEDICGDIIACAGKAAGL